MILSTLPSYANAYQTPVLPGDRCGDGQEWFPDGERACGFLPEVRSSWRRCRGQRGELLSGKKRRKKLVGFLFTHTTSLNPLGALSSVSFPSFLSRFVAPLIAIFSPSRSYLFHEPPSRILVGRLPQRVAGDQAVRGRTSRYFGCCTFGDPFDGKAPSPRSLGEGSSICTAICA